MPDPVILQPFIATPPPTQPVPQLRPIQRETADIAQPITLERIQSMAAASGIHFTIPPQSPHILTPTQLLVRDTTGTPVAQAEMRDVERLWFVHSSEKPVAEFRGNTGALMIGPGPMAQSEAVVITLDMVIVDQPTGLAQIKLVGAIPAVQTNTLHQGQTAVLSAVFPRGSWGAFEVTCSVSWIWSYCQLTLLQDQ